MNPERWRHIRRIFQDALDRAPEERAAFVAGACAGDPALHAEVDGLLRSHAEAGDFLESPAALHGPALPPGRRLGPYEVIELIDAGGMGEVYRARDTRLQRDVALKVMRPDLHADPRRLRQFESEARAAGAISDPHIVAVFDVGSEDGIPYVISELLEGETLGQRLRRGPLERDAIVAYAIQMAEGLAAAHEKGIVHRDLKPDNVFVTSRGRVKILDFGIAKLLEDESPNEAVGTPGYIAPEQAEGRGVDHRVDIFALGAVLYRMLTGHHAFGPDITTAGVTAEGAPRPFAPGDAVPAALERIVLRCLARRPEDRYQSALEVRAALETFSDSVVRRGRQWVWAAAALVAIALLALPRLGRQTPPADDRIHSLAVLPLTSTGDGGGQEYFVDGMTDALIAEIARTRAVHVISRASVMSFKGQKAPLADVGRRLGVDGVLEGTVQRSGEQVRIALRLTRAASGERVWSATYDGEASEMPALQRRIAGTIAGEIAPGVRASSAPGREPATAEAYEAYLRGRYYWNVRTADAVSKAIEQFNHALALDPLFAPAYTGLADAFATLGDMLYVMPSKDAFAKAEAASLRALELDPSQAEAHATLAHLRMHALRWDDAEREFQRAIDLNPGYAPAYQWRAYNLASLGRAKEAVDSVQRALALDPLSLIINADVAQIDNFTGRVDEAIAQCRKTIQMNPGFAEAHRILFLALLRKHQDEEALRELDAYYRHPDGGPGASVGYGYAMLGRRATARQVLAELEKKEKKFEPPYSFGVIHAALGDVDRAFAYLEESVGTNDVESLILPADPRLEPLHADPRFAALRRRMGLPTIAP
jgi:serine/threonine-protein kinase